MTHYYKIPRESETGKKLAELEARGKEIVRKLAELQEKYGFEDYYTAANIYAYGGVAGCLFPDEKTMDGEEIDTVNTWKKTSIGHDVFAPRAKSGIQKEFDACGKVWRDDFNEVMNVTTFGHNIGVGFGKEYILVELDPKKTSGVPSDAIEIMASEREKLSEDGVL